MNVQIKGVALQNLHIYLWHNKRCLDYSDFFWLCKKSTMYNLETYIKFSSVQFHLTFVWLTPRSPSLPSASYKVLLLCIGIGPPALKAGQTENKCSNEAWWLLAMLHPSSKQVHQFRHSNSWKPVQALALLNREHPIPRCVFLWTSHKFLSKFLMHCSNIFL